MQTSPFGYTAGSGRQGDLRDLTLTDMWSQFYLAVKKIKGPRRNTPFGCHMGVTNFIFGGRSGYWGGKVSLALKIPPSLHTVALSVKIFKMAVCVTSSCEKRCATSSCAKGNDKEKRLKAASMHAQQSPETQSQGRSKKLMEICLLDPPRQQCHSNFWRP